MAEAFAEKYKHLQWQGVFASPMKRTVATATPFCKAIGQNMQLRNGLKEMDFGEWEGKSTEYVQEHYQRRLHSLADGTGLESPHRRRVGRAGSQPSLVSDGRN
jgi:broad specificity phosphatase PhoE